MRLVEGEDLRSRLRDRGPLTLSQTTDILAQVADALDAAHGAHVTHRDVKPSNILLSKGHGPGQGHSGTPFVYLIDFGIARSGTGTTLTAPTQAAGTAEYTAGPCCGTSDAEPAPIPPARWALAPGRSIVGLLGARTRRTAGDAAGRGRDRLYGEGAHRYARLRRPR
ncbi:protein kinase [Streptomyces sp. NPDC006739]|uniref:protein kinase domain-containing protein n=1 Tax=Streptomyces sp. NPDC006739 TaxID=3364763 RepID=UPI0036B81C4C